MPAASVDESDGDCRIVMRIFAHAKLKAKEEKVEKITVQRLTGEEIQYHVSVKELPINGKANEAIIRVLAEYFKVPKSQVRIVAGRASREKIIDISQ